MNHAKAAKPVRIWKIIPQLAWKGMIKNGTVYYPYLGAGIFSVFTFFVFSSILHNDIIKILPKSAYAWIFLEIGRVLLGLILLPFLFYTNSFLIKRRKKEIGLYNILGLEKKHIAAMLLAESVYTYVTAVAAGILGGAVLAKLLFLLLLKMSSLPVDVRFVFSPSAFIQTAVFFFIVYAVNFGANLIQVGKARPSELLSGGKRGEKEPRLLWILALAGIAILGAGYRMAICSETDSMIFINFFLAIFFVVIGTYLLMTSGSVGVLKILKQEKKFYYKPSNFITVSGMLYRMKKNAASLVNICIFSTMVTITLTCTLSLYLGLDDMLDFSFPFDVDMFFQKTAVQTGEVENKAEELGRKYGIKIESRVSYERITLRCGRKEDIFDIAYDETAYAGKGPLWGNYEVNLLLLEDYNRMEGKRMELDNHEAVIFSSGRDYGYDRVVFMGNELRIKDEPDMLEIAPKEENNTYLGEFYLIVKDEAVRDALVEDWAEENGVEDVEGLLNGRYQMMRLNTAGEDGAREAFAKELGEWCSHQPGCARTDNNLERRSDWKAMYGGLLFIGVLFSIVFLMCLLLIMYYKQIAEGYEDQGAFEIMQKVGMSNREIKGTIHKQILLVFFVPVAGAVMHTCAGLFMVAKLFAVLDFFDTGLLIKCAVAVTVIFAAFYGGSYGMTAKTYYRIVSRGE